MKVLIAKFIEWKKWPNFDAWIDQLRDDKISFYVSLKTLWWFNLEFTFEKPKL